MGIRDFLGVSLNTSCCTIDMFFIAISLSYILILSNYYLLFIIYYLLFVIYYLLFIICHCLFVICYLLFIIIHMLSQDPFLIHFFASSREHHSGEPLLHLHLLCPPTREKMRAEDGSHCQVAGGTHLDASQPSQLPPCAPLGIALPEVLNPKPRENKARTLNKTQK